MLIYEGRPQIFCEVSLFFLTEQLPGFEQFLHVRKAAMLKINFISSFTFLKCSYQEPIEKCLAYLTEILLWFISEKAV
jgi:hypothetical protein